MKLKGYYMEVVAKTELGITDIVVFDVKTRAELVKRLNEVHPDVCRLYDFERHLFELNMKPGDESDAVALAERLGISSAYEVV
jgi:hypothetical protein